MPLGSTHDRITLWTLPVVTLSAGILSGEPGVALATGSAYLFSGLMFSGDLDTRSRQYQRWTVLGWIWLPYRRLCRHRSIWSHGLGVGTLGRLLYLGLWILPGLVAIAWLGSVARWWLWQPHIWRSDLWQLIQVHQRELLWTTIGLELGSINHSLSDWLVSGWKRSKKRSQKRAKKRPEKIAQPSKPPAPVSPQSHYAQSRRDPLHYQQASSRVRAQSEWHRSHKDPSSQAS